MQDHLVTIARFSSLHEAHLARGMLEAHGIVVALLDENINRALGSAGRYVGGIRLQVPEHDTNLAVELLGLTDTRAEIEQANTNHSTRNNILKESPSGDRSCPLCGSKPSGLLARLTKTLDSLVNRESTQQNNTCSLCGNAREK